MENTDIMPTATGGMQVRRSMSLGDRYACTRSIGSAGRPAFWSKRSVSGNRMPFDNPIWGFGPAAISLGVVLLGFVWIRRARSNATKNATNKATGFDNPQYALATLTRLSRHIVFELDAFGRVVNSLGNTLGDLDASSLKDRGADEFVHPEDLDNVRTAFFAAGPDKAFSPIEFRGRQPDHRYRWYRLDSHRCLDEDGEPRTLYVCRDIHDNHLAVTALQESEQRYRSLLDQSPLGCLIVDAELNVVTANLAYAKLVGAESLEALDEHNLWKSPALESLATREIIETVAAGDTIATELSYTSAFGRRVDTRAHIAPLRDEIGAVNGAQILFEDVTESRALEEQLRQSQKMEAIGRLAGGIAHDFNNYLTVILGCAETVREAGEAGSELNEAGQQIVETAERSASLTRQLLAFSKRQVSQPRLIALDTLVIGLEPMLRRLVGETIEIKLKLQRTGSKIWADPLLLEQVIMNLAVNAKDAMPHGGTLKIEIRETVQREGESVELILSDNGLGIDVDVLPHVFEPFFTTKSESGGTGLGLSTVYGIIRDMNGAIEVESQKNQGTSFRICVPKASNVVSTSQTPEAVAELPERQGFGLILLVEDEPLIRRLVATTLSRAGYQVVEASNGEEALACVEGLDEPIDLLVTDVMMPKMNGAELAARIRLQSPNLRVLFMSGYAETVIANDGALPAGVDLLQKPFSPRHLRERVGKALDRPEATMQRKRA